MKITITFGTLLSIFILFLLFPFFYYFFIVNSRFAFLANPALMYPVITIASLLVAFCADTCLKNKIEPDTKDIVFKTSATLVISYALLLFILTLIRYYNYVSQAVDIHFFNQVIWQLAEFKLPYIWVLNQPLYPQWSQHFSPILFFLAPLYWISPNPVMLMITQALAAITGAIPIYLIVKHHLKSKSLAFALSFAYLSFGGLQYGFDYGFHEILFFPVLFLWSYYFYLNKKFALYFLFIFLSLLVKEEVAFIVIFWSVYLFLIKKDWKNGVITGVFGIVWYILCFHIVFPYFDHGSFGYWGQYQTKGGSGLIGIAYAALSNPFQFLFTLVNPYDKVKMMLETFGQFGFLFLLFPQSLIIIFPSLMEKLLSSDIAMANGAHYSAAITAVVVVATIEALPRIYKYHYINKLVKHKNAFFALLIFCMAYGSSIFYGFVGFTPINLFIKNPYQQGLTPENYLLLNQIISRLPKNATIGAQAQVEPHILIYYKSLNDWPGNFTGKEDFVIVDTEIYPVGASGAEYNQDLTRLINNTNYQTAVAQSGIYVFRRKSFK